MNNPNLTPMQMFEIIARERGWMFNPGGGKVNPDERTAGAAAGGASGADSTFALIQITDGNGDSVILARGDHLRVKGFREHYHAEEKAINTLKQRLPDGQKIPGGFMTVVVDQVPCSPTKHDCRRQLKDFASVRDLRLGIWLPQRSKVRGAGNVSPKTATMTSMRTGFPNINLVLWEDAED